jgi:hypothetical protein
MFLLIQSDRHTVNSEIIEMFHYCENATELKTRILEAFVSFCTRDL